MDPGAQKLCLGFGSVLLHVEFIVKQEGCWQLWAYVTSSQTPMETMSLFTTVLELNLSLALMVFHS